MPRLHGGLRLPALHQIPARELTAFTAPVLGDALHCTALHPVSEIEIRTLKTLKRLSSKSTTRAHNPTFRPSFAF